MDTQQIFQNLTIKFLKPHLAKANSESHLENPPSGITFSKILKKKLSHFRFLNLDWNLNCFLLVMKLHTFNIFQPWFRKTLFTKRGLMTSGFPSGFLRVLPPFKNQCESYYLKLEKYLCSMFVCFCNTWRSYEEKIYDMIWYNMMKNKKTKRKESFAELKNI